MFYGACLKSLMLCAPFDIELRYSSRHLSLVYFFWIRKPELIHTSLNPKQFLYLVSCPMSWLGIILFQFISFFPHSRSVSVVCLRFFIRFIHLQNMPKTASVMGFRSFTRSKYTHWTFNRTITIYSFWFMDLFIRYDWLLINASILSGFYLIWFMVRSCICIRCDLIWQIDVRNPFVCFSKIWIQYDQWWCQTHTNTKLLPIVANTMGRQ